MEVGAAEVGTDRDHVDEGSGTQNRPLATGMAEVSATEIAIAEVGAG